jgi:hypothetical protein
MIPIYERQQNKSLDKLLKILSKKFKNKNHFIEKQFNFDSKFLEIK